MSTNDGAANAAPLTSDQKTAIIDQAIESRSCRALIDGIAKIGDVVEGGKLYSVSEMMLRAKNFIMGKPSCLGDFPEAYGIKKAVSKLARTFPLTDEDFSGIPVEVLENTRPTVEQLRSVVNDESITFDVDGQASVLLETSIEVSSGQTDIFHNY